MRDKRKANQRSARLLMLRSATQLQAGLPPQLIDQCPKKGARMAPFFYCLSTSQAGLTHLDRGPNRYLLVYAAPIPAAIQNAVIFYVLRY